MAPLRRNFLRACTISTTGLLAGLSGCTGGSDGDTPTETPTPSPMPTASPSPTSGMSSVGLSVENQETDSRAITVSEAAIDGEGWLVVHPEAEGGGPNGAVTLATHQLSAGEYTDVELELDRMLQGGQTVYAMLHYDDPDDDAFTFPGQGDPPVTKDGSPVIKPFEVTYTGTPTPALSVADQETESRTVTVPEAAIDGEGWLVVHPEAEGGGPNGGVTLATTPLRSGLYADIELALDRVVSGSQTVYAMLHYDDPADGAFTFPSNGDPAVTKDGSPVIKPFAVDYTGTPTPALSVTDQETDGSTVTVPSFAIDDTGWFVIHPEADGGGPNGGVTLATVALQPGLYANVTVELEEPLSADQTIYGMLHYDDPADGEFTFPANGDPAVTKDGSPVIKSFAVTVTDGMPSTPTESQRVTVDMIDTSFDPERVSVDPGTSVEWVNQDSYGHDVTAAQFHDVAASWDFSESVGAGESTSYSFDESGIYEYYCTIHGRSNMCGVVLVGDVTLDQDLPCEDSGGY